MNVDSVLCIKVEVLLWNKVGMEDVVNAMKELESLKEIVDPSNWTIVQVGLYFIVIGIGKEVFI